MTPFYASILLLFRTLRLRYIGAAYLVTGLGLPAFTLTLLVVWASLAAHAQTTSFAYTGAAQTYTVPTGVTSISVVANGAEGGTSAGGLGGRVTATLTVTPGQVMTITVGGQGGFNGGGGGNPSQGNNGGGATDIRIGGSLLSNRVLVAGGGGGAGGGVAGGAGGNTTAAAGSSNVAGGGGGGGTDTAGGAGGAGNNSNGTAGNSGVGGTGGPANSFGRGGGGGSGYFGGGGGGFSGGGGSGGGGGSSYTSPALAANVVHTQGANSGNGSLSITTFSPDYQPLVDLYNTTNGPGWTRKTGWLQGTDPCTGNGGNPWQGATCANGRVTQLDLRTNQLSGSLPSSLSALTSLTQLILSNNQLSGSLPVSLSALTNLQILVLNDNQLSGSIPSSLSALTNLTQLYLYFNQLSGGIPVSLSALTNLQILYLNDNQLSGSIPASLSALTNLQQLYLQNNQLSGSMPSSLGSLTSLQRLFLNNNQLSGSIPSSLSALTNLQQLYLNNNQLSGSIPSGLSALTNLQILVLRNNQLRGCFPASLTALCGASTKNFSNNPGLPGGGDFAAFCASGTGSDANAPQITTQPVASSAVAAGGSVRVVVGVSGTATGYQWYKDGGVVSGQTSVTLTLPTVQASDAGSYSLVASGCSSVTSTAFTLTVNAPTPTITAGTATGTITACAGTASINTQSFTFSGSNLTATFVATAPTGFEISTASGSGYGASVSLTPSGGAVASTTLYVRSAATAATGGISGNVALTATGATTQNVAVRATITALSPDYQPLVDLYNATNGPGWSDKTNWLTGCSPCGWYGITCANGRVTQLDLSNNQLTGTIPASLSALTNLQWLYLQNNQLTGTIPASLSALTNLQYLVLARNQLSGSIPASLSALTNLEYLYLYNNQLTGTIPASLSALTNLHGLILSSNRLTGTIPASLSRLTNLQILFLANNYLSGCYPASLRAFCGLQSINFSANRDLPDGGSADGLAAFCANGGLTSNLDVRIAANPSLTITQGNSTQLTASNADTYRWSTTETSNSISVSVAGPYSVTGTTTAGCSNTATATVTVNVPVCGAGLSGPIWTGCVSRDWNTAGNWASGTVPVATDDVVIPSAPANQPVLSTTATAKSVEVQSGASLSITAAGSLTINSFATLGGFPTAFYNQGIVNNNGTLMLGNTAPVGLIGLHNTGTFTNTGTLQVDRATNQGINNRATATFANTGIITIGASVTMGTQGIWNQAAFTHTGGTITIDRITGDGLLNSGNFVNSATITIGASASVTGNGLTNEASFTNATGGTITIDRTRVFGLANTFTATFINSSTITIGSLGTIGNYGIVNPGLFANSACATLTLLAPIFNNSNSFTNAGLFTVNTTRTHINNGTLTNNGIIDYPQGNPIPNVVNNDVIASAISSCSNAISPALQLGGNSNQFTVGTTWYKDQALTQPAGTYNQGTNTFTATNLAPGSSTLLYFAATDNTNNCTKTVSVSVTVNALPIASLSASGTLTCAQTSVTLMASATGSGSLTYTFSNSSGPLAGSPSANPIIVVSQAGSYSVLVTSANGCSASSSTDVSSNTTAPPVSLVASSLTFCAATSGVPPSVTLTAGGGTAYAFSGPGLNQSGTLNTATASQAGTYSVVVTGDNGCTASAGLSLSVTPTTSITAQPASASVVCVGTPVSVSVGASGASLTYQWYKGSSLLPGQTGAVLSFSSTQPVDNGSYYVVVGGLCGQTQTSNLFTLTVNARPAPPTLTGVSRTVATSPNPLPLGPFVSSAGNNVLSFSGVNGTLNPPNTDISQVGIQSFSVSQTDGNGCVSAATPFSLTVVVQPPGSQTVCRSSQVVLTVGLPGSRYEWYKNGQSIPFKLVEIASIQKGTATSSLTLVSVQTTASYYCKVLQANGSFSFDGPFTVTVNYGCIAPGARLPAYAVAPTETAEVPLSVTLTPNPLTDGQLRAVVRGAGSQPLTVQLLDVRGNVVHQQSWPVAEARQIVEWDVSPRPVGLYLLRAESGGQRTLVKVIKAE